MLLSAAEAKKGFVLGCRDQGTLSNPCGERDLWWNKLNQEIYIYLFASIQEIGPEARYGGCQQLPYRTQI